MMEIGPLSNQQSGQKSIGSENPNRETSRPETARKIADRIEISENARAKLAELADQELRKQCLASKPVSADYLTDEERIETIRRRIKSGFYNQPGVRTRIADELIDDLNI